MTTDNTGTPVRCSACGHSFSVPVVTYIDVMKTPQAKAQLLSGGLNTGVCPNCGTPNSITTPLLYHDPTKELLVAYVPMELNMQKDEQERAIGQLMNQLPKEDFKGYMFNPKRTMTMQGLVELVLEADGITKEMLDEQRQRVEFVQQFVEARTEDELDQLIQTHDDAIDESFFQTMSAIIQRVMQSGQTDVAQGILAIQQRILEGSSYGQQVLAQQQQQQAAIQQVADRLQAIGEGADRDDFMDLAIDYQDRTDHLQALVALARPAFDYEFFQMFTRRIGQAPAAEREGLEDLRARILEMTTAIDQQQQQAMQQATSLLQAVVNHPQPAEFLAQNITLIDDTFMQVLALNIEQAEQQKNIPLLTRLKEVQQMVLETLQSQMQPELLFINELLGIEDPEQAGQRLAEQAGEFGADLLEVMEAVEGVLQQQGDTALLGRLRALKAQAADVIGG